MSTATLEPEPTTIQETKPCPYCERQREIALSDEPIESPFPIDFLSTLQNSCFEALSGYLAANGAPREALDMLDCLMMFGQFQESLAELGGKVRMREYQTMLENVSRAARLNAALGGGFYGSGFSTEGSEPVIWGQFKPEELQNSLGE